MKPEARKTQVPAVKISCCGERNTSTFERK